MNVKELRGGLYLGSLGDQKLGCRRAGLQAPARSKIDRSGPAEKLEKIRYINGKDNQ